MLKHFTPFPFSTQHKTFRERTTHDEHHRRQANFFLNHSREFCKWMLLYFFFGLASLKYDKKSFWHFFKVWEKGRRKEKERHFVYIQGTWPCQSITKFVSMKSGGFLHAICFCYSNFVMWTNFLSPFKRQISVKMCQTLSFINELNHRCLSSFSLTLLFDA